jgi:hypothetical protein
MSIRGCPLDQTKVMTIKDELAKLPETLDDAQVAMMAEQVWERPHGPTTAIVASEQDTNGHSHDGD